VWSGGNPLFVEEIVAHLVESGTLESDPEGWRIVGELDQSQLPPGVSALLASRLDRLPPAERDVLERAAVIGQEFATSEAELLVEPETVSGLGGLLTSLTRREFVRRVRSPQGDYWAFKHAMVRDAAYDGLAKSLRSELHERFADGLASGDEAGGEQAGLVAHHLEQAARYRRELAVRGPQVDALVERAIEALVVAAADARDGDRYETCVAYLQRAMSLWPASTATRRRILARASFSHYEARHFLRLGESLGAFEAELDGTSTAVDRAYLRTMLAAHEMFTGGDADPAAVWAHAHELVTLGREGGDTRAVLSGLRVESDCSSVQALWRDAAANGDEIIRIGSPADARAAWMMWGVGLMFGDAPLREVSDFIHHERTIVGHTGQQELRELMVGALTAAADRSPDADAILAANRTRLEELHATGAITEPSLAILIDAYAMNRDLDGAIAYGRRVNDDFRRSGSTGFASTTIFEQALLMVERGDPLEDVLPLVEEAAGYTSPYDTISVSFEAACRALLALGAGDHVSATALAELSLSVVDRTHQVWQGADLRRWLSAVPRATGDLELERRLLREAAEMYGRKEIRSYDAEITARLAELDEPSGGSPE
jgi:hypothetical protein